MHIKLWQPNSFLFYTNLAGTGKSYMIAMGYSLFVPSYVIKSAELG